MSGIIMTINILKQIVIAVSASSPPYFKIIAFCKTPTRLMANCIINGAKPMARILPVISAFSFMCLTRNRSFVHFEEKYPITKTKDTNCDMIVAHAAPATPSLNTKMKIGSRIIFVSAPTI